VKDESFSFNYAALFCIEAAQTREVDIFSVGGSDYSPNPCLAASDCKLFYDFEHLTAKTAASEPLISLEIGDFNLFAAPHEFYIPHPLAFVGKDYQARLRAFVVDCVFTATVVVERMGKQSGTHRHLLDIIIFAQLTVGFGYRAQRDHLGR